MTQAQKEILWKPGVDVPQDDLAKRPSSVRFQLCDLCRSVLSSPEILQPLSQQEIWKVLCGGTLQNTQCSLRAMLLYFMEIQQDCLIPEDERHSWPDYESMNGVLQRVSKVDLDETILHVFPWSPGDLKSLRTRLMPDLAFRAQSYLDDPAAEIISSRPFLANPGSAEAFQQMRQWIKECEQSHMDCENGITATTALPHRVIDVKSLELHESLPGEVGQYAALTYCWGCRTIPGALVEANLEALKRDIRFELLPQTIKDAIFVTQMLGLKYIWIDAYCILQDSVEDKAKELTRMAAIYSQAYITLSASTAASVHDGFLHERQPRPRNDDWSKQFSRLVVPFGLPNRDGVIGNAIWEEGGVNILYSNEPIMLRAWTFQERLLSRRILAFETHEIYWQCNGARRSCSAFDGVLEFQRPGFLSNNRNLRDGRLGSQWKNVIQEYSRRDIAYEEDRLVALAGVASKFGEAQGGNDVYLAGLWKSWIHEQILWHPYLIQECSRSSVYVAPSWSWASLKCPGGIALYDPGTFDDENEQGHQYIEVIECATTLKSRELPFGQVTGGKIRMCGPLRAGLQNQSTASSPEDEYGNWEEGDSITYNFPNPGGSWMRFNIELGYDVVRLDVRSEAWDPNLMFHFRIADKYGLVLISEQAQVFKRVGSSGFADRKTADSFFAPSRRTVIEII